MIQYDKYYWSSVAYLKSQQNRVAKQPLCTLLWLQQILHSICILEHVMAHTSILSQLLQFIILSKFHRRCRYCWHPVTCDIKRNLSKVQKRQRLDWQEFEEGFIKGKWSLGKLLQTVSIFPCPLPNEGPPPASHACFPHGWQHWSYWGATSTYTLARHP